MQKLFSVFIEAEDDPEGLFTERYLYDVLKSEFNDMDDIRYAEVKVIVTEE